ncbi:hypothetical protein CIB84_011247, partial [Bambusicola thoracicus]
TVVDQLTKKVYMQPLDTIVLDLVLAADLFLIVANVFKIYTVIKETVKVQGNDISHKLQISKVRKKDEGLYECRVTDANYGDLQEYKAQAYLKVNANSHSRRMQAFEASPMWLQDMKPRKNISAAVPSSIHNPANQRVRATSSPEAAAKIPKQSPQSVLANDMSTTSKLGMQQIS